MFDAAELRSAVAAHSRVARIVIAGFKGSSPREVGAAMLVWSSGQSGTIGGGALEWQAIARARANLATATPRLDREALGPDLGQCCGGVVTLLTEVYHAQNLPEGPVIARPVIGSPVDSGPTQGSAQPLAVKRILAAARGQGVQPKPQLLQGWMIEPIAQPQRHLWIWGAGHVGRALVQTLSPLPDLAITWVDTAPDRFPDLIPANTRALPVPNPADATRLAPKDAEHLVLTYSHALDLDLCHGILKNDFSFLGLIGSATKWARFRSRLAALGHPLAQIDRITCPIGDPSLGKHPQAIAIGVAARLLTRKSDTMQARHWGR